MVTPHSPFGTTGLVLPHSEGRYGGSRVARYAIVRSNWQYLDAMRQWNEFE
jgi:hypothetical protein